MQEQLQKVTESFGQVSINPEFFNSFYEIFLNSSPEIKPLFSQTDFDKQKKLLKKGISYMILFAKETLAGKQALEAIAKIHDREHKNIKPELYAFWIDSLCKALSQYDRNWDENTEKAWRDVMEPGIKYFVALY
ncbi:MAG: globin [Spirochaetia bacterium]|nr:globin [Spirochaetia bacterium]